VWSDSSVRILHNSSSSSTKAGPLSCYSVMALILPRWSEVLNHVETDGDGFTPKLPPFGRRPKPCGGESGSPGPASMRYLSSRYCPDCDFQPQTKTHLHSRFARRPHICFVIRGFFIPAPPLGSGRKLFRGGLLFLRSLSGKLSQP